MIVGQKVQDGIESLKNEIRYMGEREKLITLFVIGFVFYQYIPLSAVAGYLLGGLVTTIIYITAISTAILTYLYQTYNLNSMTVFHFWTALEEGKKKETDEEIKALKKKAEDLGKAINEKEDEIKKKEEERKRKEEKGEEKEDALKKAFDEKEAEIEEGKKIEALNEPNNARDEVIRMNETIKERIKKMERNREGADGCRRCFKKKLVDTGEVIR